MVGKGFLVACFVLTLLPGCHGSRKDFLMQLSELIENEQTTQDRPFRSIGQWQELEGVHKNYVIINFRGDVDQANTRHSLRIPDVNSFVPSYVGVQLFDSQRFGKAPMASKIQIERIVSMMGDFHDKNRPNTSIITFFPQIYNNDSGVWSIDPRNIKQAFKKTDELFPVDVSTVVLGPATLPDNFDVKFSASGISKRIPVPADFDCVMVHLGFGSLLYKARDLYPDAWQMWADDNPNIESAFETAKKYAYRPFSNDTQLSSIDPRSYYVIRGFLDQAKRDGRDVALITTWVQNEEELRTQFYQDIVTPFGVNNVDIAVLANVMSGTFLAFSSGLVDVDVLSNDRDLELILNSSASLIVYQLQTNLTDRPDLVLVYYPSIMQFYWFAARNLLYMETGPLVAPVFESFYHELKAVMTTKTTDAILAARQVDQAGDVFYDDFLGTADISHDGKPINRAEDRIYTTTMAANALIYIWSTYDESQHKLLWRESMPQSVKDVIRGCVLWLEKHTLSGEYLLLNPFFSVDFKNRESVIYLYPANRFEYLNGTTIEDLTHLPVEPTIYAMEGYVEPEEYELLLKMDKFGLPTPLTFQGYNEGQGNTVLWTSDSLSYGGVMMAVSMGDVLDG